MKKNSQQIENPNNAPDLRILRRVQLNNSGAIKIHFNFEGKLFRLPVLDFSSIGLKVGDKYSECQVKTGSVITEIEVWYGNERIGRYSSALVCWDNVLRGAFGIEFNSNNIGTGQDRRHDRFELDRDLRPILSTSDPIFVGESLHFVVEDISTSGIRLSTSASNRHLMRGTIVRNTELTLPCVGTVRSDIEIMWIRANGPKLLVGVQFRNPTKEFLRDLLQFILFSSYRKIKTQEELLHFIRVSPFQIKAFKKALRVRVITSAEEKDRMHYIRWLAYYQAGKISRDLSPQDMQDSFDSYSVSYGVFLGMVMVATFRFTPSINETMPFPFEKLLPSSSVANFSRKNRVEVSRMGILPELQNSDVLLAMFEGVTREIIFSEKDLYIFSTSSLEQNYRRLGAIRISKSIPHPIVQDETLTLYMIDRYLTLTGKATSGITWHLVLAQVHRFFTARGIWTSPAARFRIAVRSYVERKLIRWFGRR